MSSSSDSPPASPPEKNAKPRSWLGLILRLGGTALAFLYVATLVDPADVYRAMRRIPILTLALATVLTAINIGIGAWRWRVLLAAYGAPHRPSWARLTHVYWIGFFYNNFLPGGVGGDLVRGVVTRKAFGPKGAAASVAVVIVERILGLSGLLLLVSATYIAQPLPGTESILPFSALGLLIAVIAIGSITLGRRLAPHLPRRLEEIAATLPSISSAPPFVAALGISLITQSMVAITGFLLLHALASDVTLMDAFVIVPLAMAATYIPISVGGAGWREGAFAALCGVALGMSRDDAVAASLLLWFIQLAVAAIGGLLQWALPVDASKTAPP